MSEIRKIILQFPSLRAFLAEYGERISGDGMLLRGDSPPADGSTVDVEVVVAEGMRLLRARGEVLWSEAGEAGGRPKAAALRFREIDEASRTLIGKIVEQRQREGAEPFNLDEVPGPREARLRDLTVPAAAVSAPLPAAAEAGEGSVFDLAQPPRAAAADLFSSPNEEESPSEEEGRRPPPVPLLADPESAPLSADLDPKLPPAAPETDPFDLPLEPTTEGGAVGDAGLRLEPAPRVDDGPAPGADEDPGATVRYDLSDLFGGDEPLVPPARGRTEAFPPSFVDEVEAELKAGGAPARAGSREDIGEFEIPLELPVDTPGEPDPMPETAPPLETRVVSEIRSELGRDVEHTVAPVPEVAPAGELEPTLELELAAEPEPATEPEVAVEPVEDLEPAPEVATELSADLEPEPEVAVELSADREVEPEVAVELIADLGAEPEAAVEPATDVDPTPGSVPEVARSAQPEAEPDAAVVAKPALPADPVMPADVARRAALAFNAEHGPETVEIPVVTQRPAADPVPPGPAPEPAPAASEPPPPIDDNLLTIPELGMGSAPVQATDAVAVTADLPSSARSLRGAASSSRHLGTWLLIALLVAALGVAGYFLLGLMRGGDDGSVAELPAGGSGSAPGPGARSTPVGGEGSGDAATPAGASPQAAEEIFATPAEVPATGAEAGAGAARSGVPEEPATAETGPGPAPVEAAPLTGLERITWSESGEETVLALVGDGEISRQQVELLPITGGQPRLVIKIRGVERPFQPAVLEVGTSHVLRVRTGLHAGGELHVVVDLAAPGVSVRDLAARGSRLEVRLGGT